MNNQDLSQKLLERVEALSLELGEALSLELGSVRMQRDMIQTLANSEKAGLQAQIVSLREELVQLKNNRPLVNPETLKDLFKFQDKRKKIEFIKEVRLLCGLSLKEAKDFVEAHVPGMRGTFGTETTGIPGDMTLGDIFEKFKKDLSKETSPSNTYTISGREFCEKVAEADAATNEINI